MMDATAMPRPLRCQKHVRVHLALACLAGSSALALGCMTYVPPPDQPRSAQPAPAAAAPAPAPTAQPAPSGGPGEFRPGVHMTQAVARVLAGAVAAEQKTNLGFEHGVTFMGAYLRPGTGINWRIQLEAGKRYAFIGGGDDDAHDVDLAVLDAGGTILARDQLADAKPVVAFTPMATGPHVVRVVLTRASRASFCALAILKEGGFSVPVKNLTTALQKIMAAGRIASQRASVRFHEEDNQWALFGAVLRQGDTTTLSGLTLEGRQHVFVAAGDSNARILNMSLMDPGGMVVAKDDKSDAVAAMAARTGASGYRLAVSNVASTGPALVAVVILDVM